MNAQNYEMLTPDVRLLIAAGLEKIQRQAEEDARKYEAWVEKNRAAWQNVLDEVRGALPEPIRPFAMLAEAKADQPSEIPSYLSSVEALIAINGLAPIAVRVHKNGTGWTVDRSKGYVVPCAVLDYEYGVLWDWRWNEHATNDLEVALAKAHERYNQYEQLVTEKASREQARVEKEAAEPEYQMVEDSGNPLVEELVRLIRDVTREELQRAGAA